MKNYFHGRCHGYGDFSLSFSRTVTQSAKSKALLPGVRVVGAKKNNLKRSGVIDSIVGDGRGRKFLVNWTTGSSTHESARGLALAAGGGPAPSPPKKRARQPAEDTNSEASLEDSELGDSSDNEEESIEEDLTRFFISCEKIQSIISHQNLFLQ